MQLNSITCDQTNRNVLVHNELSPYVFFSHALCKFANNYYYLSYFYPN